jgi:hypothetical protein
MAAWGIKYACKCACTATLLGAQASAGGVSSVVSRLKLLLPKGARAVAG